MKKLFSIILFSFVSLNSFGMTLFFSLNMPGISEYELNVSFCTNNINGYSAQYGITEQGWTLLQNVSVNTYLCTSSIIAEDTFNGSAPCTFTNLAPGEYSIIFYFYGYGVGWDYYYLYHTESIQIDLTTHGKIGICNLFVVYLEAPKTNDNSNQIIDNRVEYIDFLNPHCLDTMYLEDRRVY